jgi:hypothetical protein
MDTLAYANHIRKKRGVNRITQTQRKYQAFVSGHAIGAIISLVLHVLRRNSTYPIRVMWSSCGAAVNQDLASRKSALVSRRNSNTP